MSYEVQTKPATRNMQKKEEIVTYNNVGRQQDS